MDFISVENNLTYGFYITIKPNLKQFFFKFLILSTGYGHGGHPVFKATFCEFVSI